MNVLSILIKTIAVFDLIVIAVYFGGDIFSTVLGKFRKKPVQKDDFEFYDEDTAVVPLSIDSIRLLYSGDVADFVKEQLLPGAAKTMDALVENERTAVFLLLSALIGFLKEEGRMDEQCALPGFVDSKNEEKTERNAGYLVVSQSGGGMLRQGTREGIRRTPANRGMRAHRIVKGLDISEDVCHGMCP